MTGLPRAFAERMSRQLGNELPDFLRAMEGEPVRGIRMNPMKPFDGMESYTCGEPVPWTAEGYILPADSTAGATVFHEAGAFYLQEPAAMLPAEVLDPAPGERILDLCAAPGGKSTQIGLKMRGEGLLVCNEPVPKRAQILSRNIERMGIPNSIVTCMYPAEFPQSWNEAFDGVLADAPCSGEGMFRRDPQTREEWTPEMSAGCAKRQREILEEAARLVRPGGRLVYSTCTYNPEENEETVAAFLQRHPEFETEAFRLNGAEGENGMMLCLPHRIRGEGQFTALMRKKGSGGSVKLSVPFAAAGRKEKELLAETVPGIPEPNAVFGTRLIRVPECPDMKGVRVLRAGLQIAEIRGKNAFPDHAAALACSGNGGIRTEAAGPEAAAAYIAGNEIPGAAKGWTLVTYRGLVLGWGKGSGGSFKNHYPKGLRKDRILTETDAER